MSFLGVDDSDRLRIKALSYASLLERTADRVADRHLIDYSIRSTFKDEIKNFINANMHALDKVNDNRQRREIIFRLEEENRNLERQSDQLTAGSAKVFISVLLEENDDLIGYIIDGIGVVLGGVQVVAGAGIVLGSMTTGNVIGVLIGAHVVLNGFNSIYESSSHLVGNKNSVGFMKEGYMNTAEFLGFKRKSELMFYHGIDAATSIYGVTRLILKPDSWRLFRYIPSDFERKFKTMSKGALSFKIVGSANKINMISSVSDGKDGQYND